MKRCDEYQARLSAYLDGEAGNQEEAIRAHVESCDVCRTMLNELRHMSWQIRDAVEEPALGPLVEGVRGRIRAEAVPWLSEPGVTARRAVLPIPKLAAAAVILAALLWGVVLLGNSGDRSGDQISEGLRLSDLARSARLSETEQRMLDGESPTDDELLVSILSGGSPR